MYMKKISTSFSEPAGPPHKRGPSSALPLATNMRIRLKSKLRSNSPSADNHQDKQTSQVDKLANSNRRRSMSARPSRSRGNGKKHTAATAPDPEPELDRGDKPDPISFLFRRANPLSRARSKSCSGRRPPSPPGLDGSGRSGSRARSRSRARSKSAPRDKSRATSYRSMNSAPMESTMASSGGRSTDRADKGSSIPRSKSGGNVSQYGMDDNARRRSFSSNSELAKTISTFFILDSRFFVTSNMTRSMAKMFHVSQRWPVSCRLICGPTLVDCQRHVLFGYWRFNAKLKKCWFPSAGLFYSLFISPV